MIFFIIFLCALPAFLLFIDLLKFLITGTRTYGNLFNRIIEITGMVVLPIIYLVLFDEKTNDCCSDSATFSPNHAMSIHILIFICVAVYFYSSYRRSLASPVIEVLINSILLFGLIFNVFIAIQVGQVYWIFGNIPVGLLFLFQLIKNHKDFMQLSLSDFSESNTNFEKWSWKVLSLSPLKKIPLLFVLCLPILIIIASLLLLFGQKPDSIIRAFTDTYKHGFSQLDYLCNNVECGGHFLCSVAAKGHKKIVNPIRYGERNEKRIICNRQLLIANAFEELLEQKFPRLHKIIRRQYNKIGNIIHQYYYIFSNKFVSDIIYFLMKPLEMIFLLIIYTIDQKPENRIARQYFNKNDKLKMIKYMQYFNRVN